MSTFKQLQDKVMDRLNLTSPESRVRISAFLNERYRALATSCGLGQVRFTSLTFNTVNGTYTYSPAGMLKPLTLVYPAGNLVLCQYSMDQIRLMDPNNSVSGTPQGWVEQKPAATTTTIYIWPKPDAAYTIQVDGIATGVDMSADGDIPAFPEDFHDTLIFGASGDELTKMEKPQLAMKQEAKWDARRKELAYHIAKSAYLGQMQGQSDGWWAGPWGAYWQNFFS